MADLTRRGFLLGGLAGAGAAAFGGLGPLVRLARAGGAGDRYWVFCYFAGGWDALLGLDPRDPTQFGPDNLAATQIQPGYELLDDPGHITAPFWAADGMYVGPYLGRLADHADKLAIVRGMSMETLTHEAGRRRFITGKPPSGLQARGSSTATWLAGFTGSNEPIPNLSVRVESYNVDLPEWASAVRVNDLDDLIRALEPGRIDLGQLPDRQVDQLLVDAALCPTAQASPLLVQAEEARQAAKALVEDGLAQRFDFQADTDEMAAVRDRYGIAATGAAALRTPAARAATAVQALTQGISRVASVEVAGGLDTHYDEWATDQGPNQEAGYNLVAAMVEDLQSREYGSTGDSWLDHTTIVGFSEFTRGSMINARGGRDHSLTGACFAIGAGIRAGVIGRSSDVALAPYPTNLATGLPDEGGEVIKPEHILRALMVDAGIEDDVADLRVEPLQALLG
jgi:hypothetical protein